MKMSEEKKVRAGSKALGWGMFVSLNGNVVETRMVGRACSTEDVLAVVKESLVAKGKESEFYGAVIEVFAIKARRTPVVESKTVVTL